MSTSLTVALGLPAAGDASSPGTAGGPPSAEAMALQLEAGARELALASAMLAQAMGDLRAGFVQVAGLRPGPDALARDALQQVMVALQAEDTLGQLLQAAERRHAQLARAMRLVADAGPGADRSCAVWPAAMAWGDAHGASLPAHGKGRAGSHEFF